MCERYALVSNQDGYPARFFIFDTQDEQFLAHKGCLEIVPRGMSWISIKDEKGNKRLGLIVRSASNPRDLIASLGLSQFFIQFKHDSTLYAVRNYNRETHIASIEFAGSILDVDMKKEMIESVWIKEPCAYFNGNTIDNMEIMTKLMLFDYRPMISNNPLGYNNWSQAQDIWKL